MKTHEFLSFSLDWNHPLLLLNSALIDDFISVSIVFRKPTSFQYGLRKITYYSKINYILWNDPLGKYIVVAFDTKAFILRMKPLHRKNGQNHEN